MGKTALDLTSLSSEERLRLLEEVWESLEETPEEVPVTAAQRAELDRRLDEMDRDGAEGIPWQAVLDQLHRATR